jgi:PAS domain S-box-containing protein
MFHIFLVVVGAWMLVSIISTLPLAPVTLRRLLGGSVMSLGVVGALIAIRRGYYRAASLIYLASVWIQATVSTSSLGGVRSAGVIFYGTLPVSAAWLLGYHAALWSAGVCVSTMLAFAVLEMTGMVPRFTPHGTPLGIWFAAGTATLVGTIPIAQVLRRLLATLAERQQMEDALRKGEERFRLAIKATNDSIWDIDLKAGIVTWNDTYANLYGRPPETSDSWQWWIDNIHPEDRENTVAGLRSAVADRSSGWTCEYRFRRVGGEWAHIYDRAYIARDASGNAWRVIGAMQDLTERKSAEAALRESEERFRRVFEEGPLGLALVGADNRFLKVNSALCRMAGYAEAALARMSFVDITHPDDVHADTELNERLFNREIPFYRLQKRYVKKTGEIIWVNLTACLICGAAGEPLHALRMIEDITEIKRTQEEALLRQKLESVGTLAGGIAHDFNNLLGAVQAQAELASTELNAGSSCEEELKTIRDVAARGSEIVRQLMIYSGTESRDVGLVDLSSIVDEMLALLKVSVTKRAVIEGHLDRDLPAIRASAAQLRQIVLNLITNSSDAIGDRDGVIRVITKRVALKGASAAASFPTLADGDYVQLEVSDTGRGMSTETQAKVFDPFYSTKSAGRGLGLAVVQGIVRSIGGAIHLTSEPDRGTSFQVLLPCAESAAHTTGLGGNERKVVAPTQHGTVLVVEDEDPLRQAVVKMLRKTGLEVFEAADGVSAIARLRTDGDQVDVMLLDLTIPGASHHEVIAEAAKAKPNMAVILTSAYSRETIAGETSPLPIRSFIRKPFQFGSLVNTIRNALSGSVEASEPARGLGEGELDVDGRGASNT